VFCSEKRWDASDQKYNPDKWRHGK